jgi:hypothetical protein
MFPFALSRTALLLVAWFARYFHPWHLAPPDAAARGWLFHPARLLDVWARWDSGWYLAIAQDGYLHGPLAGQNRIAFYPAYPALLGGLHRLLPAAWRGTGALLAIGVVLSNAFTVAAVALLYRHARELGEEAFARRAVAYLLAFPTAFFLACVYTEALFLFLAVAAFHLARRERWLAAGAAGALAALTRPTGVLLFPALGFMALEASRRDRRRLLRGPPWLLLVPAAFAGYALYCWRLTGDPLAVLRVQGAWGKSSSSIWATFFHPRLNNVYVTPIDGALAALAAALGVAMLWRLPSRGYGVFTLLCVASFSFSGMLSSAGRYVLVAFPVFLVLARAGRSEAFDRAYLVLGATLQALLMAGWARMYWVG